MPDRRRVPRSTLPDQRTLLSWLFVGRLVLAIGILLGAGLVWTERPQESFLVTIAVIIALLFTGYGAWFVFLRGRQAGNGFLMLQALVDLGVVTTIVHFAGQPQSAFPALYVLAVAAYALLMPPTWGALTAICASALFLGDAFLTRAGAPDTAFWAQVVVFNVVFAIVAVLGHRLREAGMATYKAGQSKNMDMVIAAADTVTTACSNCHDVYREKTPAQGGMAARCTK